MLSCSLGKSANLQQQVFSLYCHTIHHSNITAVKWRQNGGSNERGAIWQDRGACVAYNYYAYSCHGYSFHWNSWILKEIKFQHSEEKAASGPRIRHCNPFAQIRESIFTNVGYRPRAYWSPTCFVHSTVLLSSIGLLDIWVLSYRRKPLPSFDSFGIKVATTLLYANSNVIHQMQQRFAQHGITLLDQAPKNLS